MPLMVCWLAFGNVHAATIYVNPGGSISAGIASAANGDSVVVRAGTYNGDLFVDRSISLLADPGVIVRPPAPPAVAGQALQIRCSDCSVTGFAFEDFNWALIPDSPNRARVTIRNCVFRRSGTAWIEGNGWLVEGCEFDRPVVNGLPADVEDYMNVWGSNHTIRRCYFHGLRLATDLPAGAHNDAIQMFTEGSAPWQRLSNLVIEENIFADCVQGVWISNVDAVPNAIRNVLVRNNVFWGQAFELDGELTWSAHGAMFLGHIPGVRIENNIFHNFLSNVSLFSMDYAVVQGNIVADSGSVYSFIDGTSPGALDRGVLGNLIWNSIVNLDVPFVPDAIVNPQFQNPAAVTGADVVGPDGVPFTADDAWRPMNPAAAAFGPQPTVADADTDGDGFTDVWEIMNGLDPNAATGAEGPNGDPDGDGLTNAQERALGTLPNVTDSDGDGIGDAEELAVGTDPLFFGDRPATATWVNFAYTGVSTGSFLKPFTSVAIAAAATPPGGLIRINAGRSSEVSRISRAVRIQAQNGRVTLGTRSP